MGVSLSKRKVRPRYQGIGSEDVCRHGQKQYRTMAGMFHINKARSSSKSTKKSHKIDIKSLDKTMIGSPMNFKHVGHLGVSDLKKDELVKNTSTLHHADITLTLKQPEEATKEHLVDRKDDRTKSHIPIILKEIDDMDKELTENVATSPATQEPNYSNITETTACLNVFKIPSTQDVENFLSYEEGLSPFPNFVSSFR
jgi:hypothetical protein